MADDFGSHLRHQRELRGVSIDEIASITKIHTRYLKALEDNSFDELPGEVFIKGFIRSYGKAIGANIEELLGVYDGTVGQERQEEKSDLRTKGEGESQKQVFWVNSFVGVFLAGFVLFAIWYLIQNPPTFDSRDSNDSTVSRPSTQASPSRNKKSITESTSSSKTESTSTKKAGSSSDAKKKTIEDQGKKTPETKSKKEATNSSNKVKKASVVPAKTQEKPANKPAPVAKIEKPANTNDKPSLIENQKKQEVKAGQASPPDPNAVAKALKLVIKVSENTWFNLSVDGAQEKDFILPTGQTKAFSADKLFLLTVGNRRGTQLKLNGKTLTLPKTRDNVVRDFAVTSNLIE